MNPSWLQLRLAGELVPEPWRNGGGLTLPLFSASSGQELDWRLSVALINQAGPYSEFPGLQRVQVLLDGGPLRLSRDGEPWTELSAPGSRVQFSGADRIAAEPLEPCRVGNGFARLPWTIACWLRPLPGTMMLPTTTGGLWCGQVLHGQIKLRCGEFAVLLKTGDAFQVDDRARPWVVLEGAASLLLAQISRPS